MIRGKKRVGVLGLEENQALDASKIKLTKDPPSILLFQSEQKVRKRIAQDSAPSK